MIFSRHIILILIFMISACSDPLDAQITQQLTITEQRINSLSEALVSGNIRNANLINQYAEKIQKINEIIPTTKKT